MKKTIKSLLAIAITALAFTACSDVPAPYDMPGTGGGGGISGGTGTGQVDDPYNIAAAIAKCKEIGGTESTEKYYVKGIVVTAGTADETYGNVSFDLADDVNTTSASSKFKAFQVLGSDAQKLPAGYAVNKGDEVIVYGPMYNYNGKTPETAGKGAAFIYSINGKKTDGSDVTPPAPSVEPKGTGTEADPFNVAAAIKKCQETGETATTETFFVKGIVNDEYTVDSYKNATLAMVDTEGSSDIFTAYRVKGADGKDLKQGYKIPKGATVIISGKLVNFKGNTPETSQNTGALISVNGEAPEVEGGEGGGGDVTPGSPAGTGTQADPFNVAAAVAKCKEAGETATDDIFFVKGIVDAEYTVDSYKNATLVLVDAEGASEKFTAFRVKGADGTGLKEGYKIPKGATVIVSGKLVNYKGNTPETAQNSGTLISVNGNAPELDDGTSGGGSGEGGGGSTGGDVSGNSITVTMSSFGLSNATEVTTLSLTDGTTLTFSAGGNSTTPKYYDAGKNIRMYAKNSMTINAGSKKIAEIEISCDTYNGTLCNAGGAVTVDGNNMTVDGSLLKYTGPNASTATVVNATDQTGTASQIRMTQLKITYAE